MGIFAGRIRVSPNDYVRGSEVPRKGTDVLQGYERRRRLCIEEKSADREGNRRTFGSIQFFQETYE